MTEPESKSIPDSSVSSESSSGSSAERSELQKDFSDQKQMDQEQTKPENTESESGDEKANDNDCNRTWNDDEMKELLAEAKALSKYLARHGGEPNKQVNSDNKGSGIGQSHLCLIDAIAEATKEASVENWKKLSKAYSSVSGATYRKHKISGKSILDTLNSHEGTIPKKFMPIIIGVVFFAIALFFEFMVDWISRVPNSGNGLSGICKHIYDVTKSLAPFLIPAIWGAIGACVFLSKRISDRLSTMSYEVNKLHGFGPRIFLGAMLGLITVFLIFDNSDVLKPVSSDEVKTGAIVVAFVAGLSVKPIYQGFESLSENIAKVFNLNK